jgi:hypothetical protein
MTNTHQDKQAWPIGTPVRVRKDHGTALYTVTRSKPWQLGHGQWVIAVEGISGGYDLARVELAAIGQAEIEFLRAIRDFEGSTPAARLHATRLLEHLAEFDTLPTPTDPNWREVK